MNLKILASSLIVTSVLSFLVVVPDVVEEKISLKLNELKKISAEKGIVFNYDQVKLSYLPLKIKIKNPSLSSLDGVEFVKAQRIEFSKWSLWELYNADSSSENELMRSLKIQVGLLQLKKELVPETLSALMSGMGYDQPTFNVTLDYAYLVNDKRLDIRDLSLESSDMGKLSLAVAFNHFDLTQNLKDLQYDDLSMENLVISYNDRSLIERYKKLIQDSVNVDPVSTLTFLKPKNSKAIGQNASESSRGPASVEDKMDTQISEKPDLVVSEDPQALSFEDKMSESFIEFFKDPQSLTFKLTPVGSVTIKEISMMMLLSPEKFNSEIKPSILVNGKEL